MLKGALSERRELKHALKRKEIWLKGTLRRKEIGLKSTLSKRKWLKEALRYKKRKRKKR